MKVISKKSKNWKIIKYLQKINKSDFYFDYNFFWKFWLENIFWKPYLKNWNKNIRYLYNKWLLNRFTENSIYWKKFSKTFKFYLTEKWLNIILK